MANEQAGGMIIAITISFAIILVSIAVYLYWKFTCWVAKRTNVDSCFTMFMVSMIADAVLLKGNTSLVMLVLALMGTDIGTVIGSPRNTLKSSSEVTPPKTPE